MDKIIPNYLGIGSIKSGTTWLAEVLQRHPEIFLAHGKELHFFSRKYDAGMQEYLQHFANSETYKAIGEFSVSYMMGSSIVADRIYRFNPAMKLIAILRNPVERAFSEYAWLIQRGKNPGTFAQALKNLPELIHNSLYFKNLRPYYELFPRDQILVFLFEDIIQRPVAVQEKVFRFLDVEANFDSGLGKKVIGKTISPRFKRLEQLRIRVHDYAKENKKAFVITWFKKMGLSELYRRINNKQQDQKVLKLTDLERIEHQALFFSDIEKLKELTHLDISSWLIC